MAIRTILTANDKILRQKSLPVHIVDDHIREIFTDMADTMYSIQSSGGLAACQIGVLSRMVIVNMGGGLLRLVNPLITDTEGEQVVIEGCLSCPGLWGKVKRPYKIVVKALSEYGKPITFTVASETAKCFCHEIDHLDGILFTDKVIGYVQRTGLR